MLVWLRSEQTGTMFHVDEDSILFDVLMEEGFVPTENQEAQGKATEEEEEICCNDEDLGEMTKGELIDLAKCMGIEIKSKDTVATLIAKIKEVK